MYLRCLTQISEIVLNNITENKKSQLSFLGRMNNINEQGFSFIDYVNFAGGFSNAFSSMGNDNGEKNKRELLQKSAELSYD